MDNSTDRFANLADKWQKVVKRGIELNVLFAEGESSDQKEGIIAATREHINVMGRRMTSIGNAYNEFLKKYLSPLTPLNLQNPKLSEPIKLEALTTTYDQFLTKTVLNLVDPSTNLVSVLEFENLLANVISARNNLEKRLDDELSYSEAKNILLSNNKTAKEEVLSELDQEIALANSVFEKQEFTTLLDKKVVSYGPYTNSLYLGKVAVEKPKVLDDFTKKLYEDKKNPLFYDLSGGNATILIERDNGNNDNIYPLIEYLAAKMTLAFPYGQSVVSFANLQNDTDFASTAGPFVGIARGNEAIHADENKVGAYLDSLKDLSNNRAVSYSKLSNHKEEQNIWTYNKRNEHSRQPAHFLIINLNPLHSRIPPNIILKAGELRDTNRIGIYTILIFTRYKDDPMSQKDYDLLLKQYEGCYHFKIEGNNISINDTPFTYSLSDEGFNYDSYNTFMETKKADTDSSFIQLSNLLEEDAKNPTAEGVIRIPLGKAGHITTYLTLDDRNPHTIITGYPGSGKSVLLHDLILGGAYLYRPDELIFYLLDLKEGVEFSTAYYDIKNPENTSRTLPHIKFMTASEPSAMDIFQLLQTIIQEQNRRATIFKNNGVKDIKAYNKQAKVGEKMPRLLVIIDEFSRLYMGLSRAEDIKIILELIVRLGRAFGIHLIIAMQTPPTDAHFTNHIRSSIEQFINFKNSHDVINTLLGLRENSPEYQSLYLRTGNALLSLGRHSHKEFRAAFQPGGEPMEKLVSDIKERHFAFPIDLILSGEVYDIPLNENTASFIPELYFNNRGDQILDELHLTVGKSAVSGVASYKGFTRDNPALFLVGISSEMHNIETLALYSTLVNKELENKEKHIHFFDFSDETPLGIKAMGELGILNYSSGYTASYTGLKDLAEKLKEAPYNPDVYEIVVASMCDDIFEKTTGSSDVTKLSGLSALRGDLKVEKDNVVLSDLLRLAKNKNIALIISVRNTSSLASKNYPENSIKEIIFGSGQEFHNFTRADNQRSSIKKEVRDAVEMNINTYFYYDGDNEITKLNRVKIDQSFLNLLANGGNKL